MDFRSIRNVDLISVGSHPAMTGRFELRPEHVESIIRASQDPFIRDAVLKIGHLDVRFMVQHDGEPAYGWVRNLRENAAHLLGDYVSMPVMLAELSEGDEENPAPFRNRSVEITWDVPSPSLPGARPIQQSSPRSPCSAFSLPPSRAWQTFTASMSPPKRWRLPRIGTVHR